MKARFTPERHPNLLPTLSRAHCVLMYDPLFCSVEYENAIYPAAVQRRFAVRPSRAPAVMGNHSWPVFVTSKNKFNVSIRSMEQSDSQYHNEPT